MTEAAEAPSRPSRPLNWILAIGCASCLGCGGLFAACTAGLVLLGSVSIKSSAAYQEALDRVRASPAAVAELGEPIDGGWWINGSLQISNDEGSAEITVPVEGPSGSGELYIEAELKGGEWTYERLQLELDGSGRTLDLLDSEATADF